MQLICSSEKALFNGVVFRDRITDWCPSYFFPQDTALGKPREMFSYESDPSLCEGEQLCATLSLTSPTWAAFSDGTGKLTLLRTSKRGESLHLKWEVGKNQPAFLLRGHMMLF